jgi:hypothetical protein
MVESNTTDAQKSLDNFSADVRTDGGQQIVQTPDEYDDWTPRQKENWEDNGKPVYEKIDSEEARDLYLRTYRPKKRGEGMMKRDSVSFGDVEHYLYKEIEDTFNPKGSFHGVMMAKTGVSDEQEELVDEVVKAKVEVLDDENPDAAKRLVKKTAEVAENYGVLNSTS